MEKIWHKKKKTRILLIIIANVMVISMMLGVMSIMSYAELFDDLITGKLTQSYEDSYDFDTELMNSAYQVMSGIDSEQMFETDGKIDEDKLVLPRPAFTASRSYTLRPTRLSDILVLSG